ncbi:ATP-binding protein [Lacticaseibacillus saniviri]
MVAKIQDDSILLLTDREKVRQLPGMYIGDNDKLGLSTIVREVIDNAIDEFANYTDKSKPIEVTLHSDNSVTVRDYGRGISPYESRKNPGQIAERLAYSRIGAGGKMKANRGENEGSKID